MKKKRKIKWRLLITREVCFLERYLRVLGYRGRFFPITKAGVKNLLGISRQGMVEIWDDIYDGKRLQKIIKRDFSPAKAREKFDKYFNLVVERLKKYQRELNKTKSLESLKKFTLYYTYCRAIVYYTRVLSEAINKTKKKKLIKWCGYWHHKAEDVSCQAWDALRPFFNYLKKKSGVSIEDMHYYTPKEFKKLLRFRKKVAKEIIEKRKVRYILVCLNSKIRILTGKAFDDFVEKNLPKEKIKSKKVIYGTCGFPGKVKGKVRIVNTITQAKKMKKGEILISTMTAPRLSMAFKFAKAFVTNEGGLTCHAVIVARELKIPCIIGTKIATKVLKDRDKVEVDATKGVVKKI